jgi:hypothetical protein
MMNLKILHNEKSIDNPVYINNKEFDIKILVIDAILGMAFIII